MTTNWENTFRDSYMYQLGKQLDTDANGHVWKRDDIVFPDGWVPPDALAFAIGIHNGPICESCKFSYCIHCQKQRVTPCPNPRPKLLDLLVQAVKLKRGG